MAMEITNNYNAYENTYAAQKQQETAKQRAASKQEVSETTAAQKKTDVGSGKAGGTAEYMKELSKLAPSVDFKVGSACSSANSGKSLTVSPKLLEKIQNDSEKEKNMKEMIKGVEAMSKLAESITKASGWTIVYQHSYIDENGKYHCRMQTRNDGMLKLSDKLREERRKNAEELLEKSKEKAAEKREALQEALEDNKTETEDKKADGEQENSDVVIVKNDTPLEKAEQMLLEKLNHSENGEIYIDDEEMRLIIQAATEDEQERSDKIKNPVVSGNNFDMQV